MSPLTEDTVLEDRYRIDGLLSYGGMGAVYKAYDTNLQIEAAIKENYFTTPQAIEQFKREALILARLRHPGLPRVLQHFSHEGQQYLVMEFIPGKNLWEAVKDQGGPFAEEQALDAILKVCDAVAYLHAQDPPIIHRDIKPQNIKLTPSGEIILVDFGVAKLGGADSRTATGARGVTPGFSPPEQYGGGGSRTASDIYALGATLYALLTGIKPPDSVSLAIGDAEYIPPDEINPDISSHITSAISAAMKPKPDDRPQTVEVWKEMLLQIGRAEKGSDHIGSEQRVSQASRVCVKCGATLREGVRFCEECGTPIAAEGEREDFLNHDNSNQLNHCPKCGDRIRRGIKFCENCGTTLN